MRQVWIVARMKFLCDQMINRIGKWLRAAGYDTRMIQESCSDHQILELALAEQRLLITRDRHFLAMKEASPLLHYLKSNDFDACMAELNGQLVIDWLKAPFSRCLVCNTLLEKVMDKNVVQAIPERIRQEKELFWYCPSCKKFYWEGSHTASMLRQLKQWQEKR